MKRLILMLSIIVIVATSAIAQLQLAGPSWDGYRQRGKVKVRAGGSVWSVQWNPRLAHAGTLRFT